jgi:hypothetical protein
MGSTHKFFGSILFIFMALAGLAFLPGCSGDETVNNYYEMPGFVRITTDFMPNALPGVEYDQTITAVGGSENFVWSIEPGGTNDSWLWISVNNTLRGTPTTYGQVIVTVRVEDFQDSTKYDTERFVFYVTPPSYPGTAVDQNNLAGDGMAFSPSNMDVSLSGGAKMFMFTNHANGTGIFLSKMTDVYNCPTRYYLCASYFDGTSMGPMVELHGYQCDETVDFDFEQCRVIFLNSTGETWDGDAVVLFTRTEMATVPDVRLHFSYFDVSDARTPITYGEEYGFRKEAMRVDTHTDSFNVDGIGIMTDGLYVMSVKFGPSFEFYLQGNPMTYAAVVWTKVDASGNGTLWTANLNLSAQIFSTAVQHTPATTMDSDDQVSSDLWITGDTLVYRVELEGETAGNNDFVLEAATWDTVSGQLIIPTVLTRVDADSDVLSEIPTAVYGSVEGLDRVYVVGIESGYDESLRNNDQDVMVYTYDPATGIVEQAEIDSHTTNTDTLDARNLEANLNRTGGIVFVGWIQQYQDAATGTESFYTQAVQTIPSGGAARTLANSLLASPVRMNSDYQAASNDYADVMAIEFDEEVIYFYGNQSDHLRCSAIFLQQPDTWATDSDNYVLRTAYLKVTLGATGTAPPTADAGSGYTNDTAIYECDQDHPFWSGLDMDYFVCKDSGTTGIPIVYFIGDYSTPLDDPALPRLYAWDGRESSPSETQVSSTSISILDSGTGAFMVKSMPFSAYDGTNPDVSSTYHNMFFLEYRYVVSRTMLRHRCLDLNSTASTLIQKCFPSSTSSPFLVSRDDPAGVLAMMNMGDIPAPMNSTTIGIYFKQGIHLWFSEYTPGAGNTWTGDSGLAAPFQVDEDDFQGDEVLAWNTLAIAPFTSPTYDMLENYPTFYVKSTNLGGTTVSPGLVNRIFCRFHD